MVQNRVNTDMAITKLSSAMVVFGLINQSSGALRRTFRLKTRCKWNWMGVYRHMDDTTGAVWRHVVFFSVGFLTCEEGVPSYFNCSGFAWNTVYPWDSKRVLWTRILHPPLHLHSGEWVFIFGWTMPLRRRLSSVPHFSLLTPTGRGRCHIESGSARGFFQLMREFFLSTM